MRDITDDSRIASASTPDALKALDLATLLESNGMSKARELAELGAVYDSGALSNRNFIINGAMQVCKGEQPLPIMPMEQTDGEVLYCDFSGA